MGGELPPGTPGGGSRSFTPEYYYYVRELATESLRPLLRQKLLLTCTHERLDLSEAVEITIEQNNAGERSPQPDFPIVKGVEKSL